MLLRPTGDNASSLNRHEGVEANGEQAVVDTKGTVINLENFAEDVHQLDFDVARGCAHIGVQVW